LNCGRNPRLGGVPFSTKKDQDGVGVRYGVQGKVGGGYCGRITGNNAMGRQTYPLGLC